MIDAQEEKTMQKEFKCDVDFFWDSESAVWIATSKDVKGLVLEDASLDHLMKRVQEAIPELLMLNQFRASYIDYHFVATRDDRAVVYG